MGSECHAVQHSSPDRVCSNWCPCLASLMWRCPRLNAVFDAFEELVQLWAFAEDLESFEYSCKELLDLFVGTVRLNCHFVILRY